MHATGLLVMALSLSVPPAVEIVAHRGASHDAPENTVAAMRLAWEQKADAVECDIYLTRDGKIAVIHDKDTKRTAGTSKLVAQSTLAELRTLDVGTWKNAKYAGEKVPTLEEVLETVPEGKRIFIEVKCGPEIVPELGRVLAAAKRKPETTPIISFNADVVKAVKESHPELPAYWVVSLDPKKGEPPALKDLIARAKEIKADGLDLSASPRLDANAAKSVKAAGLRLFVWTVNDPALARRMVEVGVEGITTDRPGWLREQLAR